jgi:cobalamin biosynthesis Mg chelatase CobN
MADRLVGVLAEVARAPDVNAYLGNPDRDGSAKAIYVYEVVRKKEQATQARASSPPRPASALAIVLIVSLVIVVIFALASWWALS